LRCRKCSFDQLAECEDVAGLLAIDIGVLAGGDLADDLLRLVNHGGELDRAGAELHAALLP
jgi:hypothetical protein